MASKSNARRQTRRGRRSTIDHNARIKVLVKENPKRPWSNAAKRFSKYTNGGSVQDFLEEGGTIRDIHWDQKHGFITLQPPAVKTKRARHTSA